MSTAKQSTRIAAGLDHIQPLPWLLIATLSITVSFGTTPVEAADSTWTNPGADSLTDPANWSNGVPGVNDTAVFTNNTHTAVLQMLEGVDVNVGHTQIDGFHVLQTKGHNFNTGSMEIDTPADGIGTLIMYDTGNVNVTNDVNVGMNGAGYLELWYDQPNLNVGGKLTTGTQGTVYLATGDIRADVADFSQGTFRHTGGTLTTTSQLNTATGVDYNIGSTTGGTANMVLDGATWNMGSSSANVGSGGNGTLTVKNGGTVTSGGSHEWGVGGNATVNIDGPGSQVNNAFKMNMGDTNGGSATVSVTNGGNYTGNNISTLINSDLSIDGSGSTYQDNAMVLLESSAIEARNGGALNTRDYAIVEESSVSVTGSGSNWTTTGNMLVTGTGATGQVNITGGGSANTTGFARLGTTNNASAAVTVDGTGSSWSAGEISVGHNGSNSTGTVNVSNGASVTGNATGYIGNGAGSVGTISVAGTGSQGENATLSYNSDLYIGGDDTAAGGAGTLNIQTGGDVNVAGTLKNWSTGSINLSGGQLSAASVDISQGNLSHTGGTLTATSQFITQSGADYTVGSTTGNTAALVLDGADWNLGTNKAHVGHNSTGSLSVKNGATVTSSAGYGDDTHWGSVGSAVVNIDGAGSTVTNPGRLNMGHYQGGSADVSVTNGGKYVGGVGWSGGEVRVQGGSNLSVDGAGSSFRAGLLYVFGNSSAEATNGASLFSRSTTHLGGSNIAVSGAGSDLFVGGYLRVGDSQGAQVTVVDGATATTDMETFIGWGNWYYDAHASMTIQDSGSRWTTRDVSVGYKNQGSLNVLNGAEVNTTGTTFIGRVARSSGTVTVAGTGSNGEAARMNTSGLFHVGGVPGTSGTLNLRDGGEINADTMNLWSTGTINMDGGKITASTINIDSVDTLNHTGGTLTASTQLITQANTDFDIEGANGGNSEVVLNGASWTTDANSNIHVGGSTSGAGDNGRLTVETGGSLNAGADLKIWDNGELFINGGAQAFADGINIKGLATVDGSLSANSLSLEVGGRLKGSGTVNALTTIGTGAVMAPGNSPGTQTFSSGLTWTDGGTFEWEINDFNGTAGSDPGWDVVNVTGGWDISGLSAGGFNIDVMSLMLSNVGGDAANFDHEQNYSFDILSFDNLIGTFSDSLFSIDASGFSNAHSGVWLLSLDNVNNNLMLSYNSVPAPAMPALIALGLGLVLIRRRAK